MLGLLPPLRNCNINAINVKKTRRGLNRFGAFPCRANLTWQNVTQNSYENIFCANPAFKIPCFFPQLLSYHLANELIRVFFRLFCKNEIFEKRFPNCRINMRSRWLEGNHINYRHLIHSGTYQQGGIHSRAGEGLVVWCRNQLHLLTGITRLGTGARHVRLSLLTHAIFSPCAAVYIVVYTFIVSANATETCQQQQQRWTCDTTQQSVHMAGSLRVLRLKIRWFCDTMLSTPDQRGKELVTSCNHSTQFEVWTGL